MTRRLLPSLVLACALSCAGSLCFSAASEGGTIAWETDPAKALAVADKAGKPVLVDTWAVWCVPCKEMDKTTYRDPRIVEVAGRFVPLKVDADLHASFGERYRLEGLPTLLVLDGHGEELARLTGYIPAKDLLPVLVEVRDGYLAYSNAVSGKGSLDDLDATLRMLSGVDNAAGAVQFAKSVLKNTSATDAVRHTAVELRVAEAQLAAGDAKGSVRGFRTVAAATSDPQLKARALSGLYKAEKRQKHTELATKVLDELRAVDPQAADNATR